jgi:hypothetical protein
MLSWRRQPWRRLQGRKLDRFADDVAGEFVDGAIRKVETMRIASDALYYAVAATILMATVNTASPAHSQTQPRYRHSVKRPAYVSPGGYYSNSPQPCAPFSRDKMDEAIVYGDSKFLTCNR